MEQLIIFIGTFLVVFFMYYFFVVRKPIKHEKYRTSTEVLFLVSRYQLDINKIRMCDLLLRTSLANALIIALTVSIITLIEGYLLKMVVGLALLIPLIFIVYHIIGKHYQNRKKES